ncbi:tRNA (adenosine(37)-N6)-threonylcarbamoyltransferase complex ATPase subunit type 1 TsaE [Georgenia sp. EYE_87]|uniref:tRNA (adenosine(37)-N6)-threonylcarbamoyltransferase complex ATPase subunit type 1 TsaE n=1 Tax=Georgenia sp. EYE_87 TaxID=2853448 RepID=UPI00200667E5|nr:tRNA (adenosine(37)-N6)-threonylcarbamoyltransferase complex ATPase subunit type 1 TsaE [Georgenia sp. EYE_87]MCK6209921.1 tRNA (adenosine(37)-N6)-threonylcarbamoyltransferase complex ATPase subunit type 1 TsaE [Georgenia sp. EYE_87]
MTLTLTLPDADATRDLGRRLAAVLRAGDLVLLSGDLGAGKTTLTQGIGTGLGVRGQVASPTFIIARVHPALGDGPDLVHVDAYRLGSLDEVDALDLDTSLEDSVTVVEWGAGKVETLSADRLEIDLRRPHGAGGAGPGAGAASHGGAVPGGGGLPGGGAGPDGGARLDAAAALEDLAAPAAREVEVRAVGERWAGVDLAAVLDARRP